MATVSWTDAGDTTITTSAPNFYTLSNTVDCSDVASNTDYTGANGDIIQCLSIPAGTFVSRVILDITTEQTAATDTVTIDVGDGDDPDGWMDGVDGETAAVLLSSTGTWQTAQSPALGLSGKYYASDDTIDVKVITSTTDMVDDLVFKITAFCVKV